ncbi:hypothetical protein Tco_0018932 [Tanacetum coccineum]
MDSKFVISTQTCTLLKEQLVQFLHDYDIPRDTRVILPKKSETIYDSLLGFVGLYTHYFSLSNLILPIPSFICDVLNYFKAYGGESSVDLLPSFLNLGRAGDWLTLSNRGGVDMPKALIKPITHLENWKGMDGEFTSSEKGFDVNKENTYSEERKLTADGFGEGSHHGARKVLVQVSKVVGDASTPLNVDSDPDIHEFPSARELKDATNCHWVVAHIDSLRQDRAAIVTKVIPDAAMKLVHSDEMGVLITKLVRASIIHSRCATFEEVAKLNEPFILEKMPEYHTSSKEEYDQARDDLANASYSFLFDFTSNPYAYVEQMLSKKPRSLRSSKAP